MSRFSTAGCVFLSVIVVMQIGESQQSASSRCRSCSTVTLESTGSLVREPVPGAAKVTSMKLTSETSSAGTCVKDDSYGYIGPEAYVDMGCAGDFEICYVEGRTETVTCSSSGGGMTSCAFSQQCDVRSVALVEAPSTAVCIERFSFMATRTGVSVCRGCEATFTVGCRECVFRK